jgi:hypothetical protein
VKLTIAVAMVIASTAVTFPASAQRMTPEQREEAYYSCRYEYVRRGMGNDDAANAYCYNKYYNETPYSPPPGGPCASLNDNCTRPF